MRYLSIVSIFLVVYVYKANNVFYSNLILPKVDCINEDSLIYAKLSKVNFKEYYGKPIKSILKNPTIGKYNEIVFATNKPGYLTSVLLLYSKKVFVRLEVENYRYVKPFNLKANWSFKEYQKEILYRATVVYQ